MASPKASSRPVDDADFDASGYWYDEPDTAETDRGIRVLNALRRYRAAESDMRRRTRTSMKMGETDLEAIRFLLRAQMRDEPVSAKDLADHLGITTASTSVLVNRLVKSGHLERHPHPTDRRGVLITTTDSSDVEVRATLDGMHARMIRIAEGLDETASTTIAAFLDEMAEALAVDDDAEPDGARTEVEAAGRGEPTSR
ncbi:MarR family winged helix-turn-helix transcriptional regulator [Frondihabitans australicus]|uniref:DNA-binding MarR family transcriptional regulator n=1 Tax=Frondihabitans australicus TaxID=386892 RepID=A0A495IB58_9MICO|nr:MarR family transcriptional regulator [Frondihabitans australicus]RKR73237.1 DNA-binding MarR family transcriptional regulator [Frondihabitans australicus]